ncbi:MAG: MoaD/ThiS family protein [Acidobacteriota bacterium]|nr:MoaD/ThiS family protein [Acidobacteriota bacterium]
MPRVVFTPNLERHVAAPPTDVNGTTVRELFDQVFENNPKLRGYVLDDQGRLRQHVVVFINGEMIRDRDRLADEVAECDEIFVMQALSGG